MPGGQGKLSARPVVFAKRPGSASRHDVCAGSGWYVPSPHSTHSSAPGCDWNRPGLHGVHCGEGRPNTQERVIAFKHTRRSFGKHAVPDGCPRPQRRSPASSSATHTQARVRNSALLQRREAAYRAALLPGTVNSRAGTASQALSLQEDTRGTARDGRQQERATARRDTVPCQPEAGKSRDCRACTPSRRSCSRRSPESTAARKKQRRGRLRGIRNSRQRSKGVPHTVHSARPLWSVYEPGEQSVQTDCLKKGGPEWKRRQQLRH